jgi:2-polyprenyl-3-methyl-5-hydroxy-6-metoxy-1,4-benzoquinol methylase
MKKLLKKLMRLIPAQLMYCLLNLCASIVLRMARFIALAYTNLWGSFDLPWFDHRFDWLRGPENWVWNERGIYGAKIIRPGDKVLDICCGDGIYSGLYYSMFAGLVHAIDRDERALSLARKRYSRENVKFFKVDVTKEDFPLENYDVILMFAAIEHFSVEQGTQILQRIARALSASSNGSFLGSTPIFGEVTGHGHPEHDNEFTSIEQLQDFLSPHFAEIEFWSSKWGLRGERKETYFLCKKPIVHEKKD